MIYGYIRVSTQEQNLERQQAKMRELGARIYSDKASGKDLERPAYTALMRVVKPGDTILFDSLDRLGRNYDDITTEWRRLVGLGVNLKVLDLEFFDSEKFREMGDLGVCLEDMLLSLLSYVAQTERKKNQQRQREGIEIAKSQGKYKGKKKTEYSEDLIAKAQEALTNSGKRAAAKVLGCHYNTVYNMIADGRLSA